jgi:CxxC-x17-CxxC domain-containing protein
MAHFDRNSGGGSWKGGDGRGKPSFPKKSWGGDKGGSRGDVVMHKATCSDCNKTCEVPFRPTGDKPVFCKDCFNGKRDGNDSRGGNRTSFNDRGAKSFDKPSFRSDSRPSFTPAPAASSDGTSKQLADISNKLDRLASAIEKLSSMHAPAQAKAVVAPKAPEVKKVVAKAVKAVKAPAKVVAKKPETKVAKKKVVVKKK